MKITRIAVYMLAAVALVLPLAGCINSTGHRKCGHMQGRVQER